MIKGKALGGGGLLNTLCFHLNEMKCGLRGKRKEGDVLSRSWNDDRCLKKGKTDR